MIALYIILTVIMALRAFTVGVDTLTYMKIFISIGKSPSLLEAWKIAPLSAPLYIIFCRMLSYVSLNPQILTVMTSILVNFGLFVFVIRESKIPVLSIFCWVGLTLFYCSMNGNRQCLAVVLTLNSLHYLSRDLKSKKGWLLFGIAVGVHSTALILLIAVLGIVLSNRIRNSRMIFIIAIVASTVFSVIFPLIVTGVVHVVPRYAMYISGNAKYSILNGTGGGRVVILYMFLLCIVCLWIAAGDKENDEFSFNRKMLLSVVFCSIFGAFNCKNELINRMLWYYLALYIVFIPDMLSRYCQEYRLFLKVGIVFVLVVYSFLSLIENQNGVVPYISFFR
ncbi:MAG: EpsG family protein [Brotaphodocola sp.]